MRRVAGHAHPLLLLTALPLVFIAALPGVPRYAVLKEGPFDLQQLYALLICAVTGCISQSAWLLAHIGDDRPRPALRWVGEIMLGGFAAYVACAWFLKYGPVVELPQLIVPAVIAGFLGQRLLVYIIEYLTTRFKLPSINWGQKPPHDTNPPPAAQASTITPPAKEGEQDGK